MTLNFPNQSRSYDATLRAVRFWGYDGAMEASFYVNEDALKRIQPGLRSDEAGILAVFDSHRDLIYMTAARVYRRGRKGFYELIPAHFRRPPRSPRAGYEHPRCGTYDGLLVLPLAITLCRCMNIPARYCTG